MKLSKVIKMARKLAKPYCVSRGEGFRLADFDPQDTAGLGAEDKPRTNELLQMGIAALAELQDRLFAQDRWSLLLLFQAMDAAGKDGAIKHVMSGVNPQGCEVSSFKTPTSEELDHDFLWRCIKRLPERGRVGIFNRSYYEEVLVVRVHPELLHHQKIPPELITKQIWEERFRDIRHFEHYLTHNGTMIRKVFLHVSFKEQKRRFLERIERPEKNWKFSPADVIERQYWKQYMKAYEEMIRATATPHSPWYVIPADHKWFTRAVVAALTIEALASVDLRYPELSKPMKKELARAKKALRLDE